MAPQDKQQAMIVIPVDSSLPPEQRLTALHDLLQIEPSVSFLFRTLASGHLFSDRARSKQHSRPQSDKDGDIDALVASFLQKHGPRFWSSSGNTQSSQHLLSTQSGKDNFWACKNGKTGPDHQTDTLPEVHALFLWRQQHDGKAPTPEECVRLSKLGVVMLAYFEALKEGDTGGVEGTNESEKQTHRHDSVVDEPHPTVEEASILERWSRADEASCADEASYADRDSSPEVPLLVASRSKNEYPSTRQARRSQAKGTSPDRDSSPEVPLILSSPSKSKEAITRPGRRSRTARTSADRDASPNVPLIASSSSKKKQAIPRPARRSHTAKTLANQGSSPEVPLIVSSSSKSREASTRPARQSQDARTSPDPDTSSELPLHLSSASKNIKATSSAVATLPLKRKRDASTTTVFPGLADRRPSNENGRAYCIAEGCGYGRRDSGRMVGCDNEHCPTEWFHPRCVELLEQNLDDIRWRCPDCTVLLGAVVHEALIDDAQTPARKDSADVLLDSARDFLAGDQDEEMQHQQTLLDTVEQTRGLVVKLPVSVPGGMQRGSATTATQPKPASTILNSSPAFGGQSGLRSMLHTTAITHNERDPTTEAQQPPQNRGRPRKESYMVPDGQPKAVPEAAKLKKKAPAVPSNQTSVFRASPSSRSSTPSRSMPPPLAPRPLAMVPQPSPVTAPQLSPIMGATPYSPLAGPVSHSPAPSRDMLPPPPPPRSLSMRSQQSLEVPPQQSPVMTAAPQTQYDGPTYNSPALLGDRFPPPSSGITIGTPHAAPTYDTPTFTRDMMPPPPRPSQLVSSSVQWSLDMMPTPENTMDPLATAEGACTPAERAEIQESLRATRGLGGLPVPEGWFGV